MPRTRSAVGPTRATAAPGTAGLYATPWDASRVFLERELEAIRDVCGPRGWVAEPFSGADDLVRTIEGFGFRVEASDLYPRGRGRCLDFFATTRADFRGSRLVLITNPVFAYALRVISHAAELGVEYLALMLPASWFCSDQGRKVFAWWRPSHAYLITWRVDFLFGGKGRSKMMLAWFVWRGGPSPRRPEPSWSLIERPAT